MFQISVWIPDCYSHSPGLLDLFLSPDTSICSTMVLPPLGNSGAVVSVSIDLPSNSKQHAPFHRIAHNYFRAENSRIAYDYFPLYQQNKSSESKGNFRQASNRYKRVLEAAKLAYANETKESFALQKLGSQDIWRIAKSVLSKGKSAIPPLFNGWEVLSSAFDKAKLFTKSFSRNSNFDDSGISLLTFPSRTNLKLQNIFVTLKMVKKVITILDSSRTSGPNCIPMVVLRNCEPELSYILAKLFNIELCLKESCFPDCWKASSVVLVFKNVGERSTANNYFPSSLFSMVSKVFEKLMNNRIVDQLQKCGLFSDFQYGFRFSRSTGDLLTVASDKIAWAFNRCRGN